MLVSFSSFISSLTLKTAASSISSAKLSITRPVVWSLKVMLFHNFHQTLRRAIRHLLQHANRLQNLVRKIPVPSNIHPVTIVKRVVECLGELRPHLNQVRVGLEEARYLNLASDDFLFVLVSMNTSFNSFLLLLLPSHWSFFLLEAELFNVGITCVKTERLRHSFDLYVVDLPDHRLCSIGEPVIDGARD